MLLFLASCVWGAATASLAATALNIAVTNGLVTLSWKGDGFALQSASNLNSPLSWAAAGLPVTDIGTNHSTVTQPSNTAAFYRLISNSPGGLIVVPEVTTFIVGWDLVTGAVNYNLYLAQAPGVTPANYLSRPGGQKFSNATPPYFIAGLTNGVKYYFVVTANIGSGESPASAEASAVFGPRAEVSGSMVMSLPTGIGQTNWVLIPGAQVWLVNTTNGVASAPVTTDLNGMFSIPQQPAGTYTVCYAVSNAPVPCGTVCSTQQVVLGSEPVAVSSLVFTSACPAVYGRVLMGGDFFFQDSDSFFGFDVKAQVKLVNGGQTNSVSVNQSGEFVFLGVPPGSYVISADCEESHVQQNIVLPTAGPILLEFTNRAPVILNAYAQDPATGRKIFRAAPGATVRLVVEASDADGDPLTYDWIPGPESSGFQSSNSPSVLWQLPFGSGVHVMYFVVRDHKGGLQTAYLSLNTDPDVLFSGRVLLDGAVPTNGAQITINGQTVSADASGYFTLHLTNPVPPYVMTIVSQGSELFSKVFEDEAIGGVFSLYQGKEATFDSSAPFVFDGPVTLGFPTGSVVNQLGQTYFAPVIVTYSMIDPADPAGRLPGNLNATNANLTPLLGASIALRTVGGQPLYINPFHPSPAFVTAPLGVLPPATNNTPVPVWLYNPTNGVYTAVTNLGTANLTSVTFPLLRTGVSICALSNAQSTCLTLEMDSSINLPVDVTVFSPAAQVKTITKQFTTFEGLPPNQLVVFRISEANEVLLTNSRVISNAVTTGAAGTNCVSVKLTFPSATNRGEMLTFRVGEGDTNYGNAYYEVIDPTGSKRTFPAWKEANGFNAGADAEAIYFNNGDLGFGRWMGMKTNANGDVAYFVSNYGTADAAIQARAGSQTNGLGATVCMEYSAHPDDPTTNRFTKFYIFDELNRRVSGVELDGRGVKFVPHLCIVCHGGIEPSSDPAKDFGNVKSKFLPFDLESFKYSQNSNFTQTAQASAFKILNAVTLCTASTPAITNLVDGWYGGQGLPGNYNKDFIPPGWTNNATERELYSKVIKVSCRSCHIPRNGNLSLATFENLAAFKKLAKLDDLICNSRTMPNALRTFNIFWSSRCGPVDQPCLLRSNPALELSCPTCPP